MPARLLLLLILAVPCTAADRTHTVVPEDYFSLARIGEVAVSPDGKFVAYAEARWDKADDRMKADLWVLPTDGASKPVRLTFDRANDRNLKWSADAKTIYFLSNRKREAEKKPPYDGSTQVWCLPATGGEPRAVTRVEGGIDGYDLAPAANAIFYSFAKTHHDDDDFARLRKEYKLDYGNGVRKVSEIHRLSLDDWRTEKIYDETRYVRELATTRDGKRLALVTAFDDTVVKSEGESRVDIWQSEPEASATGTVVTPPTDVYRKNAPSPHAWLENLAWNPEGTAFAFTAVFDGHPAEIVVGDASDNQWSIRLIPRGEVMVTGYGRGSGSPLQWLNENTLAWLAEQNGRTYVKVQTRDGTPAEAPAAIVDHIYGYHAAGNVFANIATPTPDDVGHKMAQLFIEQAQQRTMFAFDPNTHANVWKNPRIKHITWKAPDGTEVGGVLELPHGYDGKSKLPLVVAIHGGPTTSSKAALEFDPHNGRLYFSAAGYAVLCPNYRGSTGYGDKFVTDLIGRENDIEVNDIIAGVEHLVKEGIADPERVGVMGWSNGGYLTNCLITRKDLPFKLKAASSGAGILDCVAEWGFNDEPAYPWVFKKGHPWETPEIYKRTSPTYDVANITTPTLIHVGGNDVRCPPGHSRMLHRALHEYLKVPTELCEYPGEPHGLTTMTNRRAKMLWDLAWFEKYMK